MEEFYPYFTNDGSVGLYSPIDDDIYHSTYGALTEAYEKFILPANFEEFLNKHNEIKILDICYGIGYNSKSFLNYFYNFFEKKIEELNKTIDTIDTDNKFNKIYIKAIEKNKYLYFLSPFIRTNKKIFNKNKINFKNEKISKFISEKTEIKYKFNKFINIIILKKIIKNNPEILEDEIFIKLLKKYKRFLEPNIVRLFNFYRKYGYKNTLLSRLNWFLHNIYYRNLSKSYKRAAKHLKLNDFILEANLYDARDALLNDSNSYDYVFLDAFTPAKCPTLWTLEFFKLINSHLKDTGMLLTYSNSASIRNGLIQAGFWVGKIYDKQKDKFIGTIATKKLELIKFGLTEYDLGLINTKAGIIYRDENLNGTNESINAAHKNDVENSTLQSSSKFIKNFRGVKNV